MRYFLDMNLPVYSCFNIGHPLEVNAKRFVESKENKVFLLCDYIFNINLPKWLKRQRAVLFEFNQKTQNPNYNLFSSEKASSLLKQDKVLLNVILSKYHISPEKNNFKKRINEIFGLLDLKINAFLKKYVDEVVIPSDEIDSELRTCLFDWLAPNDSDARTIASAIQEHKNNPLIILTSDKEHWTKDLLESVHSNIQLSKIYPNLPKIEYLQEI